MAAAILPIIQGASSIFSSIFGANQAQNAANTASGQEQAGAQGAINGLQPWANQGLTSLSGLMNLVSNGTYGAGSLPNAPNAPGSFQAPTLSDVQNTPGYQFTQQQGNKGILQGAAAAGGAISGGTLKALSQYTTGLADNTYGNAFNRNLQGYQANLADYNAQLGQYQANLGAQNQQFQQNFLPAQLASGYGYNAQQGIGNLMNLIGQYQAAGTLGSTQALLGGLGSATKAGTDPSFLGGIGSLFGGGAKQSSGGGSIGGGLAAGGGGGNALPPVGGISPFNAGAGGFG